MQNDCVEGKTLGGRASGSVTRDAGSRVGKGEKFLRIYFPIYSFFFQS